jgi:hypothetical protein
MDPARLQYDHPCCVNCELSTRIACEGCVPWILQLTPATKSNQKRNLAGFELRSLSRFGSRTTDNRLVFEYNFAAVWRRESVTWMIRSSSSPWLQRHPARAEFGKIESNDAHMLSRPEHKVWAFV